MKNRYAACKMRSIAFIKEEERDLRDLGVTWRGSGDRKEEKDGERD